MSALQLIVERFKARLDEIKWRGVQRDAITIFSFVLAGSFAALGVGALIAPLPLFYLAVIWMRHDLRIGTNAKYLQEVLEPNMVASEGENEAEAASIGSGTVQDWESFVRANEPLLMIFGRRLSEVVGRTMFPSLQLALIIWGVVRYAQAGVFGWVSVTLVVLAVLAGLGLTALTFMTVKHVRQR